MNIKIVTDGFSLTDAINDYVHKKLEVISKHLNQNPEETLVEVILRDQTKHKKGGYEVEVNIPIRGGIINANEQGDDFYAAVDALKDSVVRELEKHNTKHRDVARKSALNGKEMIRNASLDDVAVED